jgi:hypothetical protein
MGPWQEADGGSRGPVSLGPPVVHREPAVIRELLNACQHLHGVFVRPVTRVSRATLALGVCRVASW